MEICRNRRVFSIKVASVPNISQGFFLKYSTGSMNNNPGGRGSLNHQKPQAEMGRFKGKKALLAVTFELKGSFNWFLPQNQLISFHLGRKKTYIPG